MQDDGGAKEREAALVAELEKRTAALEDMEDQLRRVNATYDELRSQACLVVC